MAKKVTSILVSTGIILACWLGAESFVLPTKRNVSIGSLKQECCQLYAEILKILFHISGTISEIEAGTLDCSLHIIEGSKDSPFASLNKPQLCSYIEKLDAFRQELKTFDSNLQEQLKLVRIESPQQVEALVERKNMYTAGGVPTA